MLVGQTTPVEFVDEGRERRREHHRHRRVADRRHDQRERQRQPERELIQGTPGGRDIWGAASKRKCRACVMSRPDVGGTSGGLQGTFSARGTTSAQNTSFLNGINVGDPAAIGAAGFYYDFDAFDDIQVSTGAHDITVPTSRRVPEHDHQDRRQQVERRRDVHLARRQHAGPQRHRPDAAEVRLPAGQQHVGLRLGHQRHRRRTAGRRTSCASSASFRDWRVHQNVPVQNSQIVLDQTNITSGLGNFTWQAEPEQPAHRLLLAPALQQAEPPAEQRRRSPCTDSTSDEEDMFDVGQGLWNSVIGKNFFLDARARREQDPVPDLLNGGNQQSITDNATGIIYGNYPSNVDPQPRSLPGQRHRRSTYVDQALGGRHEFKFGFDYSHARDQEPERRASTT